MTYISQVNVTHNHLFGEWKIVILSQGSYSIQVQVTSGIYVTEDFYQIDYTSPFGLKSIDGKPIQGKE